MTNQLIQLCPININFDSKTNTIRKLNLRNKIIQLKITAVLINPKPDFSTVTYINAHKNTKGNIRLLSTSIKIIWIVYIFLTFK